LVGSERGGRKSVHNVGVDMDTGLTLIFDVGCSTPYYSMKSMGGHDVSMLLD
jgi:hypothetical protein